MKKLTLLIATCLAFSGAYAATAAPAQAWIQVGYCQLHADTPGMNINHQLEARGWIDSCGWADGFGQVNHMELQTQMQKLVGGVVYNDGPSCFINRTDVSGESCQEIFYVGCNIAFRLWDWGLVDSNSKAYESDWYYHAC